MNNTPTPETDCECGFFDTDCESGFFDMETAVNAEFARKLERERDEARELLASEKITRNHIIKRSVEVERERDEAKELAERMFRERAEALKEIHNQFVEYDKLFDEAEKIRVERDEAREERDKLQVMRKEVVAANKGAKINAQVSNSLAGKLNQAERERDEARKELENEMKWHHQTHKELVEAQCKLLDIEYDKLKS